jgi:hypothetical protein
VASRTDTPRSIGTACILASWATMIAMVAGCGGSERPPVDDDDAGPAIGPTVPCDGAAITAPPASLGLDPFYTRYLDADGIPIVASSMVPDAALARTCEIVRAMLSARDDVRDQMIANRARVAVMAATEVTTDIPEHRDLYTAYPGTDWDARARGLGGTPDRPVTSCAEENVLCDPGDRYHGESILVHELAHGVHLLGLDPLDASFGARLHAAYTSAIGAGLWARTYAATDAGEYWAEGVQSFFDTNLEADPPDGVHNHVSTRAELLAYDPTLHALIAEVFPPSPLPLCD